MTKEKFKDCVYGNLVKFEHLWEIKSLGLSEKEASLVDYFTDFLEEGAVPPAEEQIKSMFAAIEAGEVYEPPRTPFEFSEDGAKKVADDVSFFIRREAEQRFFETMPKEELEALCVAAKALEMTCLPNNEVGIKLIGGQVYNWSDLVYYYNAHQEDPNRIKVYRDIY